MKSIASQSTFNLQYEMKPRILRSIEGLSSGAKDVYTYLFNIYNKSSTLKTDNIGQYLTASRKAISKAIGRSVKTVIGYIVELVKVGLIKDRRMGVKEINRIYFFDVDSEYKYEKKQEEDVVDDKADERKSLIKQVKELILPLQEINSKQAKGLLIAANSDIDLISKALAYVSVRPYKDLISYLGDTIRNRYYESQKSETPHTDENKKHTQYPNKQLQSYHRVDNHEHNAVGMAELLNQLNNGWITEEEYNIQLKALW